jgi:hypothetical protein
MSHFSPVPPEEREYAKNYRRELESLEAELVEVTGRCKEFRNHPERQDLQSLLLVDISVKGKQGKAIHLSHLWVLTKHVQRAGVEPHLGKKVKFTGSVYAYYRLGGKSKQRGLHGLHDFSILPMEGLDIETFEPGLTHRYDKIEGQADSDGNGEEGGSGSVGEGEVGRPKHSNRRRRNNRPADTGSKDGDREHQPDKHKRSSRPRRSRRSRKANPDGGTEDPSH